ncbi:hypothetical protein GCK32_017199 [Trichostrongylus colubriformis]|uniref:Uncharacterized protein n=1 Tax=Trichostrongylus colubriformis TaxID=6319 RepID=A0AAN8IRX6_TRICO
MDDDVKVKQSSVQWMNRETSLTNVSLWNAKLFPVESTRERSLKATLDMAEGVELAGERISIAEAVATNDVREMVAFRRLLKAASLMPRPPSSVCP